MIAARACLDLPDLIVLALRREWNRLGLSQRDLAETIGTSSSAIGRLETTPGATGLDRLLRVLRAADLLVRDVRGRRYPGHGTTTRTDGPPRWLPANDPGWDPRSIWRFWRQPT